MAAPVGAADGDGGVGMRVVDTQPTSVAARRRTAGRRNRMPRGCTESQRPRSRNFVVR